MIQVKITYNYHQTHSKKEGCSNQITGHDIMTHIIFEASVYYFDKPRGPVGLESFNVFLNNEYLYNLTL